MIRAFVIMVLLGSCVGERTSELDTYLNASGGYERWKDITELSFTKVSNVYERDSSLKMHSVQQQKFRNSPSFYGEIIYVNDSLQRRIIQEGDQLTYYEGDVVVQDRKKIESAATSMRTAFYVIGLPFKLVDNGVNIKSIERISSDGKELEVVHVKHEGKDEENWWLYFYPSNKLMQGYLIQHDNRFSHIINDETTIVNGFSFPLERRSISSDSLNQNPYLIADYKYSNIKIVTDE